TRSGIEQATAYFEARGHRVVFGPHHREVHGYLAGTDEQRAADLQWALGEPRIVCGYSDITALHLALAAHLGWVTFYGPNFLRFTRQKGEWELGKETEEWFH